MSLLSVIVPCYNEEESVALFYQELTKNDPFFKGKEIELELLYIDDGSRDGTVREVKKLIEQDSRVHIISFSRNFGKEAAMFAGLEKSKGDYVVMMEMELLEASGIFPGRHYRIFHSAVIDRFLCGSAVLCHCFSDDRVYHRAQTDLRRSGIRLAFSGVHHFDDQRRAVFLYGDSGTVSGKSVHGSKTPSDLPG